MGEVGYVEGLGRVVGWKRGRFYLLGDEGVGESDGRLEENVVVEDYFFVEAVI